jgi:hypothetical protein
MSRLGAMSGMSAMSRIGRQDTVTQGIVTLESQRFTMDFIRDNDLLPVLFPGKWDEEAKDWAVSDSEEIPTLADGGFRFDTN